MHQTYSWILAPAHEHLLGTMVDEFVTGKFRVLLRGNTITVEALASEGESLQGEARHVAERYVKLLAQHLGRAFRLMTVEEFRSLPSTGVVTVRGLSREDSVRVSRAVQKARQGLVKEETLTRCYDYLQTARESDGREGIFHLYKLIEAVKNKFSGWEKAIKALKVQGEVKFIKELANKSLKDLRHAPKAGEIVQPLKADELGRAMESAKKVLQACERHCAGVEPEGSDKGV